MRLPFTVLRTRNALIAAGVLLLAIIAGAVFLFSAPRNHLDFALRQKVSAQNVLHFSFPDIMDTQSVRDTISSVQKIEGDWAWNGDTLTFDPAEPLKAGQSYTFLVPSSTLTADGGPLGRNLEFVFIVAGPPAVVAEIPGKDSVDIEKDSRITLVFDRPMIPLSQVQGEFAKDQIHEWPVTIDPPTDGRWRWLSTVAREFIPSKPLTEGTKYTVTVPAGILSVAGDKTEKDFSWSFETLRPLQISQVPEAGSSNAGPSTKVTLHFNRTMDLDSAKKTISIYKKPKGNVAAGALDGPPEGEKLGVGSVKYGLMENDKGTMVTDKTAIIVSPASPFEYNTSYGVYVEKGLLGTEGNLGTASGYIMRFSTVGAFTVNRGEYRETENTIVVTFSNPLADPVTQETPPELFALLNKGITIEPAPLNAKDSGWSVVMWSNEGQATINPDLKPSTTYKVTVKGVKDIYGQLQKEPFTFAFKTPPVTPRAFIHSEGPFGIFERGKSPVYYLNAVNVSKMDLEFAKIDIKKLMTIRSSMDTNAAYVPSLEGSNLYKTLSLPPPGKKDEWGVTPFDVSKQFGETLPPGIYALLLRAPEYTSPWDPYKQAVEQQYFAITNMAITLKYSGDKALVWVTDMQTGEPVKSAIIAFNKLDGKQVRTGTTDAQGFFETALPIKELAVNNYWEPEFWVTAEKGDDIAFVGSNWYEGLQAHNFEVPGDFHSPQTGDKRLDAYIYTERPIYKAGDTVSFKGIVRLRDWNGEFSIPSDRKAVVIVTDSSGNEIYNETLPVSAYGSFHASFPVSTGAVLGSYYLNASLTPDTELGYNNYTGTSFAVLAYRKPEYQVDVTTPSEDYFDGQTVKATIKGSYYFGAPMSQATVVWRAITTDYYFNKFTDGWYSFALEDNWCWYECVTESSTLAEGRGVLDATGRLTVDVPLQLQDKGVSQVLSIEADITDANNQVVSNRTSVYAHKADAYVGIRTTDYVVSPNSPASVDLVTLKPDGTVLPNTKVSLQLYSRTWNSIRKKSVDGEYYYDNEPVDTFIRGSSAATNERGRATGSFTIPAGGEYRIVATVSDAAGHDAKSATSVYAYSNAYVNWPRSNSDRMDIVADKPEYNVGDTAIILIKSPYQGKGVKALVTVERENVLTKKIIDITSNAQSIEIPITADLIPNIYVSVVVIKPRMGETFNEHGLDTGAPAFKVGYAKLKVETSSKDLHVEIKTDKETYGPGEKVNVTLTTTDAKGSPVPAELSLGTVDMSLLALSSFRTPDLTKLFYADRGLGVNTAAMLSFLLERFKPGSKGGDGSDPESRKRGNFRDTAYWNPSIITDASGKATISFNLPDNLTTWQLLAVGSTKGHQFGSLAKTVIETKKVIIRPVRPRFALHGDQITLGGIVHNFLPERKTFMVTLTGTGFIAKGNLSQQVTLDPGSQQKLNFPIEVIANESLLLRFKAETDGAVDEIEERIPVHLFTTPQSVATTGVTQSVALEKVIAPNKNEAPTGTLDITLSPSLAAYLPDALEYLVTYPYGCAEQVMSSFMPMIALSRLDTIGATDVDRSAQLKKHVIAGLTRIYRFQRSDGGFGYFDESWESNAPLTAYILQGLVVTKNAGFSVDQDVIDRTIQYLQGVRRSKVKTDNLSLTERATILFALSEAGKTDVSLLNALDEHRGVLPQFAKAQMAMAYKNAGSSKADAILKDILDRTLVDSRGTHFEESESDYWNIFMNTTQRTTAIVLQAMLRIDPDSALIPNVTRYLLTARESGHWDSTQSTAQALLAFDAYLQQTAELEATYQGGVEVNGKRVLTWDVDKESRLQRKDITMALDDLVRGKENEVKIGLTGEGRLYYDLVLSYLFTGNRIEPAEEGIGVLRDIRKLGSKTPGNSKAMKVGDTYTVTLTITVPQERHYVAIESPVPAGSEIIDVSLETSQKGLLEGLDSASQDWSPSYWEKGLYYFGHREVRDDRYFLFAETLPPGVYQYTYLVRATTPGTFRRPPTRVYEMYFPEVFGQTDGDTVTISE